MTHDQNNKAHKADPDQRLDSLLAAAGKMPPELNDPASDDRDAAFMARLDTIAHLPQEKAAVGVDDTRPSILAPSLWTKVRTRLLGAWDGQPIIGPLAGACAMLMVGFSLGATANPARVSSVPDMEANDASAEEFDLSAIYFTNDTISDYVADEAWDGTRDDMDGDPSTQEGMSG